MSNHYQIYRQQAMVYDNMIAKQPDLSEIVASIRPYEGLDVLDLGAGSGRLSAFLAPKVKSLICTDSSLPMLELLDSKLKAKLDKRNWTLVQADHRSLPLNDASVDLITAGWSISYLAHSGNEDGRQNLKRILGELERVLRPGGTILIMETLGTGLEEPNPPDNLKDYYMYLVEEAGFHHRWIRTDYTFNSPEDASKEMGFFFGESLVKLIEENQWAVVPECAGVWWKHMSKRRQKCHHK